MTTHFRYLVATIILAFAFGVPSGLCAVPPVNKVALKNYHQKVEKSHRLRSDSSRFIAMCDTLLSMAQADDNLTMVSNALFFKVSHYSHTNDIDAAQKCLESLKDLYQGLTNKSRLYDAWLTLVQEYYFLQNDLIGGLAEINRIMKFAEERDDHYGMATAYYALGNRFNYSDEEAVKYFSMAEHEFKLAGYKSPVAHADRVLALHYANQHQWDSVIRIAKDVKSHPNSEFYDTSMADIMLFYAYTSKKDKEMADSLYRKTLPLFESGDLMPRHKSLYAQIAVRYLCMFGRQDEAPKYFSEIKNPTRLKLAEMVYHEANRDYDSAYRTATEYMRMRTQWFAEHEMALTNSANQYFDLSFDKIDHEMRLDRRLMSILLVLVFVILCLLGVIVYFVYLTRNQRKAQQRMVELGREISKQKERAMASEEMKTMFIQSMSHEVRTPLNAIIGFSNLLLNKDLDHETRDEYAHQVNENVDNLSRYLTNMLEMSELITSKDALETKPLPVTPFITNLVEDFKLVNKNADVAYTVAFERDFTINTHQEYLAEVITNLLDNARKFTKKGKISVRCSRCENNHDLRITVTDTGTGVPLDKQEFIFERFTKIDSFHPGMGIGLYLCRIILTRLGGKIYIDSTYTRGCRVVVEHPLAVLSL